MFHRRPRETHAWTETAVPAVSAGSRDSVCSYLDRLPRLKIEGGHAVGGVRRRRVVFVAQSQVQSEFAGYFPVILHIAADRFTAQRLRTGVTRLYVQRGKAEQQIADPRASQRRSEERRVGKECRSRWSPY